MKQIIKIAFMTLPVTSPISNRKLYLMTPQLVLQELQFFPILLMNIIYGGIISLISFFSHFLIG